MGLFTWGHGGYDYPICQLCNEKTKYYLCFNAFKSAPVVCDMCVAKKLGLKAEWNDLYKIKGDN